MARDYRRHCGRSMVSLQWQFCPYCGESINASKDLPKDPVVLLRPDGSKRRPPLASKLGITAEIHTVTLAERDARCLSAGRNKNKGMKCYKPKGHRGKHAYYEALFDF